MEQVLFGANSCTPRKSLAAYLEFSQLPTEQEQPIQDKCNGLVGTGPSIDDITKLTSQTAENQMKKRAR